MPDSKTSVCVKLMYILFFFCFFNPNEQKNCKFCTCINNCDYSSSQSWHHFCGVLIILKSVVSHRGEILIFFNFQGKHYGYKGHFYNGRAFKKPSPCSKSISNAK